MKRRTFIGLSAAAAASMTAAACSNDDGVSADDELDALYDGKSSAANGSDDHANIDPVRDDPAIAATAVVSSWYLWNPIEDVSVWSVNPNVMDRHLTGSLLEQADNADSEQARAATPDEWLEWARSEARFSAIVLSSEITSHTDTEASVLMNVRQRKRVGSETTTYREFRALCLLRAEKDSESDKSVWKAYELHES